MLSNEAPAARGLPALELKKVWKSFGHVVALRGASLQVWPGEVLALLGDNGAGKSTMVKVLAGVHGMDSGEYHINGIRIEHSDPLEVRRLGVSSVFQDLGIVETLDIAANMFLGEPLRRWGVIADRRRMIDESATALRDLKVRVPSVRIPAGELSGGQRQGVAIARAVRQDNPIILMDEPTAALGVRETAQVAEMIRELRARGKAIILVTHDLEFVFNVADRAQIMRLGQVQGVRTMASTNRDEIVGLITGSVAADSIETPNESDAS